MTIGPHIFGTAPFLVQKVWGGRRLAAGFSKALPDEKPYGEAWEIADLEEGQSRIATGPMAGQPLRAAVQAWGRSLVGQKAARADQFPLLVKLLDANRDLSVQVHPGQEEAAQMDGAASKEETWLILAADEGGAIIHGLTDQGIAAAEFRRAVDQGVVEEILQRQPVAPGDVVHVPPGTIHAICAGVALLEIQEPSDTTYRVYDYERPGLDGKPRPLHLEQALAVAHLGRSDQIIRDPAARQGPTQTVVACEPYRIENLRFEAGQQLRWAVDDGSTQILHVLGGALEVADGLGDTVALKGFQSAVVPASMGHVVAKARADGEVIVAGLSVPSLVADLEVDEVMVEASMA